MTARLIAACVFAVVVSLALSGVAAAQSANAHKPAVQHVTLVVKSDTEHGKKGPDGKWHDAFLPASFTVEAGAKVVVSVRSYDDGLHSFSSPALHLSTVIWGGSAKKARTTTFTFVAPKKAGRYPWHCNPNCDPWAMKHLGFMRGFVIVTA